MMGRKIGKNYPKPVSSYTIELLEKYGRASNLPKQERVRVMTYEELFKQIDPLKPDEKIQLARSLFQSSSELDNPEPLLMMVILIQQRVINELMKDIAGNMTLLEKADRVLSRPKRRPGGTCRAKGYESRGGPVPEWNKDTPTLTHNPFAEVFKDGKR